MRVSTPPPDRAPGRVGQHFADRWRRLVGDEGHAIHLSARSVGLPLERDDLVVVWVTGRERRVCRSERGIIALVHHVRRGAVSAESASADLGYCR
jgi:hypothetical protein